jgi:hypothetical protein
METRLKLSKLLQIGLLLTFFLPFFPRGCEPKKADEAPVVDSTVVAVDTMKQDSSKLTKENEKSDTLKTATFGNTTQKPEKAEVINEDKELSAQIAKKSTILKLLLRPNENYTGIASLIDYFSFLELGYGLGIAFILWIIGLIIKLKDFNNTFLLINIIGLVFLSVSHSLNVFNDTRLWGFWVCLIWSATMIIYDCIILLKIKKERQNPSA